MNRVLALLLTGLLLVGCATHAPQSARPPISKIELSNEFDRCLTNAATREDATQCGSDYNDRVAQLPEPKAAPPSVGTIAAGVGLVLLGVTALALASSAHYPSYYHPYRSGWHTTRTRCTYGLAYSVCTTR